MRNHDSRSHVMTSFIRRSRGRSIGCKPISYKSRLCVAKKLNTVRTYFDTEDSPRIKGEVILGTNPWPLVVRQLSAIFHLHFMVSFGGHVCSIDQTLNRTMPEVPAEHPPCSFSLRALQISQTISRPPLQQPNKQK